MKMATLPKDLLQLVNMEDLAKSFTFLGAEEKTRALGRLQQEIVEEIKTDSYRMKQ